MSNSELFAKIAFLNHVRRFDRFHDPGLLSFHFWMSRPYMLPTLTRKAYAHPVLGMNVMHSASTLYLFALYV